MGNLRLPKRLNVRVGLSVILLAFFVGSVIFTIVRTHSAHAGTSCPCSIFDGVTPTGGSFNDSSTETLGVRFKPDLNGYITGVKFYKDPAATGVHKGTLWDNVGNQLATGTFTNETASGWQLLTFSTPVAVTAGATYTAGYTVSNSYVAASGYFTTTSVDNFPLTTLATNQYDGVGHGGNGVFSAGDNVYPTSTFNGGNYWADVTFVGDNGSTGPTVDSVTPVDSATNIGVSFSPSATFSTYLDPSTISSATAYIKDQSGNTVDATPSFDESSKSLTITPNAPLALNTTYTVTLVGGDNGLMSLDGTALASDYSWQFTTETQTLCPCSAYNRQALSGVSKGAKDSTVTLGAQIKADESGYISAIRYYRQMLTADATHTVGLYSASGVLLGSGTSTTETATGWQTIPLTTPVAITANTTYLVAYTSNDGRYVYGQDLTSNVGTGPIHVLKDSSYFNYAAETFPNSKAPSNMNYWIDPVFTETSTYTPDFTLDSAQPVDKAYGVDTHKSLTFTFTQPLDASTIANTVTLTTSGGQQVAGTTTYDASTGKLTFTPGSALNYSTVYTVSLASSLKDSFGTTFAGTTLHFTTGVAATTTLNDGKGGPILVVTSDSDKFSTYTAEILRAEGINYFTVKNVNNLDSSLLNNYKYVLLGSSALSTSQVQALNVWVSGGGNLIAFKPDKQLAPLLGLTDAGGTLSEGYLKIDTATAPGHGIVGDTIQYHTAADRYTLSGATSVATLYSDPTTPTFNPAVTMRSIGKGHAGSFTYDLPQSIVLLHQGNPAWISQSPDGTSPIRPDGLFRHSGQTDWINLAKADIPQADEQQRLLVNMLTNMSTTSTTDGPAPHYWYLPHGYKAALELTSDDHGTNGGTAMFFNQLEFTNPGTCSLDDWTCNRAGSLVYVAGGPTAAQASLFNKLNYPMGVHVNTGCNNQPLASLQTMFTNQINQFSTAYPDLPAQQFGRVHCYVWSGWADVAKLDNQFGIHYSMEYEWYPPSWTGTNTGLLTGSAQVMRFADSDGTIIDTYNAPTDLDYETDPTAATIDADLSGATGASGFYGIYGTHFDYSGTYYNILESAALQYGVPTISAEQALTWKNAQSNSTFDIVSSSPYQVVFKPQVAEGGEGSVAMLPTTSSNGALVSLTDSGTSVSYSTSTIKGVEYAVFDATPGTYTATYGSAPTPPANNGGNSGSTTNGTTGSGDSDSSSSYNTIFSGTAVNNTADVDAADTQPADASPTNNNQQLDNPSDRLGLQDTAPTPTQKDVKVSPPVTVLGAGIAGVIVVGGGGWWLLGAIRRRKKNDETTHTPFTP